MDNPSGKRKNDSFEPEQIKRRRTETPEERIVATNITDLNDDCLEHVFKNLGLKDLLSVVHSSKYFKQAANLAYASKYRQMKVYVARRDVLLTSLRRIRCFGHLISSLEIWFRKKDNCCLKLGQYVNRYCAKTLDEVELRLANKEFMNQFTKVFSKVTVVHLYDSDLNGRPVDFNRLFPQIQRLEIHNCRPGRNKKCIENHFPNLQHLTIVDIDLKVSLWHRTNIVEVMRLNPQLQRLDIKSDLMNVAFIREISEHLQNLKHLDIWCRHIFDEADNNDTIHFKNVKFFTIGSLSQPSKTIPLSFDQLEAFTTGSFQIGKNFLNFIHQHRSSLTKVELKLTFLKDDPLVNVDKMELASTMELLTDIDLGYGILSIDEANHFLDTCKNLKRFIFYQNRRRTVDDFSNRISDGTWRKSDVYHSRTQLKRQFISI